jgi:lipoprotein-anchoring transpeptidase ErfK/SrfK
VRGRYVRLDEVTLKDPPKTQGVLLGETRQLPYAFVYGDGEASVFELARDRLLAVGRAEVHARFPVAGEAVAGTVALVVTRDDLLIPRGRVRIARRIDRPAAIPSSDKWIHVDLNEQTLVAYEGDQPVFATLVSTGKEESGHATPAGLYRIREKHLSVTMSGEDPADGYYEVAEVPWTQFYHDSFALHGAYWHDSFGKTRSHGCTNIPPPDARWLFLWTTPDLPRGAHAVRRVVGTHVYLTRDGAASSSPSSST